MIEKVFYIANRECHCPWGSQTGCQDDIALRTVGFTAARTVTRGDVFLEPNPGHSARGQTVVSRQRGGRLIHRFVKPYADFNCGPFLDTTSSENHRRECVRHDGYGRLSTGGGGTQETEDHTVFGAAVGGREARRRIRRAVGARNVCEGGG